MKKWLGLVTLGFCLFLGATLFSGENDNLNLNQAVSAPTPFIPSPSYVFNCGAAGQQYLCTVQTDVTQLTVEEGITVAKAKLERLAIVGVQGIAIQLESWNGAGSEIIANCQKLALKSKDWNKPLHIEINWFSKPYNSPAQNPDLKLLNPVLSSTDGPTVRCSLSFI